MDYIVNMLVADGNTNEVFSDSTVPPFLLRKLLVCRGPRMDGQRFGVTDTMNVNGRYQYGRESKYRGGCILCEVRDELEPIDNLTSGVLSTFYPKGKDSSEASG